MIGMEDTDMPCIVMYTNVEVPKEKARGAEKSPGGFLGEASGQE